MTSTSHAAGTRRSLSVPRLAGATVTAAVAAAAANSLVRVVTVAVSDAPGSFAPLQVPAPVVSSVVAALGAGVVFAVVLRFAREPARVFTRISLAVLVLSFAPLVGLAAQDEPAADVAGADAAALIGLGVMHVVAYLTIVPTLLRLTQRRGTQALDTGAQDPEAR